MVMKENVFGRSGGDGGFNGLQWTVLLTVLLSLGYSIGYIIRDLSEGFSLFIRYLEHLARLM